MSQRWSSVTSLPSQSSTTKVHRLSKFTYKKETKWIIIYNTRVWLVDTIAQSRRKQANRTGIDRTTQPVVHLRRHPMCATVRTRSGAENRQCAPPCAAQRAPASRASQASQPVEQASRASQPRALQSHLFSARCAPQLATKIAAKMNKNQFFNILPVLEGCVYIIKVNM